MGKTLKSRKKALDTKYSRMAREAEKTRKKEERELERLRKLGVKEIAKKTKAADARDKKERKAVYKATPKHKEVGFLGQKPTSKKAKRGGNWSPSYGTGSKATKPKYNKWGDRIY